MKTSEKVLLGMFGFLVLTVLVGSFESIVPTAQQFRMSVQVADKPLEKVIAVRDNTPSAVTSFAILGGAVLLGLAGRGLKNREYISTLMAFLVVSGLILYLSLQVILQGGVQ